MAVRMAHIQLPEDLGIEDAILPGDPARVDRVAALLEQPEELMFNREYKSVRGLWKGRPVLIISTGMGGPSTVIAVEELARTGVRQMIRIGSCGALTPTLDLGDLVLVCGAVRDDGTSAGYLPAEYPAVPDLDLLNACRTAARRQQAPYQIGIARSHDCMYRDDNPALYETWSRRGVIASDMETATMLVVGRLRGVRCASILNVVAGFHKNVAESVGRYQNGEQAAAAGEHLEICTALDALDVFHQGSSRA